MFLPRLTPTGAPRSASRGGTPAPSGDGVASNSLCVARVLARYASSRVRAGSCPSELKPYRLITAPSSRSLNTLGLGLPGCGLGVTLPISTNPKPMASSAGNALASLSNPAARPIGFANRRPHASTASSGGSRLVSTGATPRARSSMPTLCAVSGSIKRIAGARYSKSLNCAALLCSSSRRNAYAPADAAAVPSNAANLGGPE